MSESVHRLAPTLPDPVLRPVRSPSDGLFRVGEFRQVGPVVRASMPVEERHREADGHLSPGILGVLIDSVLAYTCLSDPQRWSLTVEMTLDVFPALHDASGPLHAEAQAVHADRFSGYATGFVRSDDGRLVAACSQLLRFTEGRPSSVRSSPAVEPGTSAAPTLVRDLLVDVDDDPGAVTMLVAPGVQNPMGNLHGGVSMYACERAVARALTSSGAASLTTTSLRVTYLRAVPAGSRITFRPSLVHGGRTLSVVDVVGGLAGGRPAIRARACAEPRP